LDLLGEKEYYEKQIATLRSFEDVERIVNSDSLDEDDDEQAQHERAMKISNYANVVLLAFKVWDPNSSPDFHFHLFFA